MKVYLAARYDRRDELRVYRDKLESLGVTVTSRWLDEQEPLDGNMTHRPEDWYRHTAYVDLEDVARASALIFFSEDPNIGIRRGGRHVEFGYAKALGKPIFCIGFKENVFHYTDRVYHFKSFDEFVEMFCKYADVTEVMES